MRTSMAMAALLWSGVRVAGPGGARQGGGPRGAGAVLSGLAGRCRRSVRGGAGTDRAGEPAQVDVQARHEAGAWGLIAHIDGTHGLIV
ncbi:hypothetical protein GCM10009759_16700 [Kitasatospora saccharophila]|uniref:Secreted protein n=1 Tax=Kitasatospora saccharophila TaxID=407973 RepID=A0ABN2WJ24_9ACTN